MINLFETKKIILTINFFIFMLIAFYTFELVNIIIIIIFYIFDIFNKFLLPVFLSSYLHKT